MSLPGPLSGRLRDLGLGVRFAVSGGREGWTRTLLTAIGVGIGVLVLLGAASVPTFLHKGNAREHARMLGMGSSGEHVHRSDHSFLYVDVSSQYRSDQVSGYLLRPDGAHPALPPGVDKVPGPGEMVVSPALRKLLASPEGRLLKERYDYRVVGTVHDAGLTSPFDLYLYAGSSTIDTAHGAHRADRYGAYLRPQPLNPVLVVMVVLACVVLLVPVAVFIATAVRFGGERRDRRLAALRLVGADARMTRRTAAGEALFGTLLGVALGGVFFLGARQILAHVQIWGLQGFPADVTPMPALAALILLAVPLSAVAVTLFALRSVTIEPLGVVRSSRPRPRRLWWRLPVPAAGVALLLTAEPVDAVDVLGLVHIAAGVLLSLLGLVLVLPWLVEAAVRRLRGGPVPWQLAVRRLQLHSGGASRAVAGISIAVAGGIALQMFTVGIDADFRKTTGADPKRAQFGALASYPSGALAQRMVDDFGATKGVKKVIGTVESWARPQRAKADPRGATTVSFTVGSCGSLRELAHLSSCENGDAFRVTESHDAQQDGRLQKLARPGTRLAVDDGRDLYGGTAKPVLWTLPKDVPTVASRRAPDGTYFGGILATPGAIDPSRLHNATTSAEIQVDESVPDVYDLVRNTAFRIEPGMRTWNFRDVQRDQQYTSIRSGVFTASALTLTLIAAAMLVSQIEQLRERRRLLSVLVAYGTRRSTLAWSVLWQTALPVVLALALAVAGGLGLGRLMLGMAHKPVTDWGLWLPLAGVGLASVATVTLLSLPPLYRWMRPDGLRTE
ncbi:FtsX-like permease family protein [Streptomyces beihaiensis]|uniref:ABC transporter permease n=1 Tax=Streptomyces beihaiensis TaxID=2984495 RepID=A0ABT3TYB4_9ACTN|nr:FtsX-like permease family protein [Streptomyces beihaiensis]MCX3062031.1 ABC transporter permease [Streptomyces beihaiensis]